MGWKDILKFELRNPADIKRLGLETSIDDMVEGSTPSQEEYDRLSEKDKRNFHLKMARWLKTYGKTQQHKEESQWHTRQASRYASRERRGLGSVLSSPLPPNEDYGQKFSTSGSGLGRPEREKPVSPMIVDYFKMYDRMYNRIPTLQEIMEDEGRPLTADEIESFARYAQREE
jgi:hypothetical protein